MKAWGADRLDSAQYPSNLMHVIEEAEGDLSHGVAPRSATGPTAGGRRALSRRRFLAISTCGCACAAGRAEGAGDPGAKPEPGLKPVDIGAPSEFPKDGISEKFGEHEFFVIRQYGRLYATTSICSHMGNPLLVDPEDDTRIICSGHESVFDADGRVVVGPASHSLVRLGVALNDEGHILVNPGRKFPEDKWEEKGSYLAIE